MKKFYRLTMEVNTMWYEKEEHRVMLEEADKA